MITVNAIGDTCPIPVVKTKKAIEALTQPDTVETLVDNEVAVENLKKMAVQKNCPAFAHSTKYRPGADVRELSYGHGSDASGRFPAGIQYTYNFQSVPAHGNV